MLESWYKKYIIQGTLTCLDTQNIIKNYASVIKRIRPLANLKQSTLEIACVLIRASSRKLQATSLKRQAPSLDKNLLQASSPKQQAPSFKPKDSSAKIPEPGNNWKRLAALGPRASTRIKLFLGCFTWNAIWCGENLIFIPLVTFNYTVKKVAELL